ncbi:prephenate dehydrogenase [Amycolatopsis arida]|uniref:Prephenate dehydrogenase n=1 Tax=Amycolatopsis arida TaxID=587909 RepID=A0A1I5SGL2_9PSEU|nr:prephenate dehydrogenase [Amycolatopsis arida]TDX96481.1 prephenate dehydrogenase [Amycolatopsis arida]SFP69849.1 prephenate dehydrogenase [Amycolatopsis arida]
MSDVRAMCVIGLGLIGGSLLRAASAAGHPAWAASASTPDAEAAAADGFDAGTDVTGALRRAADADAMVVLAVPLTAVDDVLRAVAEYAPECLLTDVTSVKGPVRDAVRRRVPRARFVGGHPMAGTARSGWAAGSAALFSGAAWVTCVEEDTDLAAWAEVAALALAVGAHVVPLPADAHDEAVARISHLPHLFAAVLAGVGAQGGPVAAALVAGSFTDGTRVAGSRPELLRAMVEGNRDALLPVLDEALGRLGAARGSLASTGGLAATINAGHEGRRALEELRAATRAGVRVDLTAPDARQGLRALGERGGRLVALDGTVAVGEVAQA